MAVNTKDKYYTPDWLVKKTVKKAVEIIGKENIKDLIEPSAGDGAFIEELDKLAAELGINVSYYDLYPSHPRIIEQDYKTLKKSYKRGRVVIGNPPFGVSSSLWKSFCRKSARIADWIVFISPASQYKTNYYFKEGRLIYSELLENVVYRGDEEHDGKDVEVKTCLNIYKCEDRDEEYDMRDEWLAHIMTITGGACEDADIFTGGWGGGGLGKLLDDDKQYSAYRIKILNKSYEDKIKDALSDLRKEVLKMNHSGTPSINSMIIKEHIKKKLWPTRDELLEQSIVFRTVLKYDNGMYSERNGIRESGWKDYEYFITQWGVMGEVKHEPSVSSQIRIKILDESKRDMIENALYKIKDMINVSDELNRSIGIPRLKNILTKLLWPTREEQLNKDLIMKEVRAPSRKTGISRNLDFDADFYMVMWGVSSIGKITKTVKYQTNIGVKILNEKRRKEIENFFNTYHNKYIATGLQNERNIGGEWVDWNFLKRTLMDELYPESEYEYLEELEQKNKTPIKIERERYGKPLF